MITHTRVIDLKTGHPYTDFSPKFMENWEWTTGRSADEIAAYMAYALSILKNVGFQCEGITTPGGFGNKALPQLAQATLQSVRDVFGAQIPHYFRHLYDSGEQSVAPRVEYAAGLETCRSSLRREYHRLHRRLDGWLGLHGARRGRSLHHRRSPARTDGGGDRAR